MAITWESICRVPRGMVVLRGTLEIGADLEYWGRPGIFEAVPWFRGKSSLRFRIAPWNQVHVSLYTMVVYHLIYDHPFP